MTFQVFATMLTHPSLEPRKRLSDPAHTLDTSLLSKSCRVSSSGREIWVTSKKSKDFHCDPCQSEECKNIAAAAHEELLGLTNRDGHRVALKRRCSSEQPAPRTMTMHNDAGQSRSWRGGATGHVGAVLHPQVYLQWGCLRLQPHSSRPLNGILRPTLLRTYLRVNAPPFMPHPSYSKIFSIHWFLSRTREYYNLDLFADSRSRAIETE